MITEEQVRDVLRQVRYPGFSRDIVSFGLVKEVAIDGNAVTVRLSLQTSDPKIPAQIQADATAALESLPDEVRVELDFDIRNPPTGAGAGAAAIGKASIPGVRHVVAVASGKGGVGKSTVAANLAVALGEAGHRVGVCDCDLYGPSIAHMFGTDDRPLANEQEQILPIRAHGIELMSMGFLLEDTSPVIVRGPMATRYTQQFLRQVAWNDLDFLVLDLPPGTGDIQLTIVQTVALSGALVVTTPQEVALIDARKAASMFGKVNVPILGVVENMSWFICPNDGNRYPIFGEGGGEREAARLGVPLLGQIPIDIATRERGDAGRPIALEDPGASAVSAAFHAIAARIAGRFATPDGPGSP